MKSDKGPDEIATNLVLEAVGEAIDPGEIGGQCKVRAVRQSKVAINGMQRNAKRILAEIRKDGGVGKGDERIQISRFDWTARARPRLSLSVADDVRRSGSSSYQ